MTNPYYNGGAFPATGAPATSASMRAELSSISSGFDKLPTLSGNASKLVAVNSSASALEAVSVLPSLTITDTNLVVEDNADSTRKFRFEASGITAGATRILTVPDANLTLVGTDTVQTLTNKTFNLTNNLFTATSAQLAAAVTDETGTGSLVFGTNPTISGATLTGGSLNNTPIGASTPNTGAFTTLSASSTVSGTGFSTYLASPPAIGSTTPAAGSFTTLSASGNVTLSGGTANGVLYLNGSKVATSGSALTFNGSSTLTFDGGSASYLIGPTGEMLIGEDGSGLYIGNGAGGLPAIPILFGSSATTFQRWFAGGTEQMRLTSTGLGIGTSSPGNRLHVNGSGDVARFTNGTQSAYIALDSGGYSLLTGAGQTGNGIYASATTNAVQLFTSGTAKATLDSSGNLGIGTSSPGAKLDVVRAGGLAFRTYYGSGNNASMDVNIDQANGDARLTWNTTNTSGSTYTYFQNNTAAMIRGNGGLLFYTAASGTAGNTISAFSNPALTLDTSGNLGLGVTPSAWSSTVKAMQIGPRLGIYDTGSTGAFVYNAYFNSAGNAIYSQTATATLYDTSAGQHRWYTAPSGTAGNAISFSQVMTLDSSGNLGIGIAPTSKLEVWVPGTTGSTSIMRLSRGVGYGTTEFKQYYTSGTDYGLTIGNTLSDLLTLNLASGNLGLGVTPSAWGSILKPIQLGNAFSYVAGRTDGVRQVWLGSNSYYNGTNWIYGLSSPAAQYYQNDGIHIWNTAPSGTAGNAISFTQAMTLDASGNLGVGQTSPSAKLHVGTQSGSVAAPTQLRLDTSYASTATPTNQQLKLALAYISATEAYGFALDNLSGIWYHSGNTTGPTGNHIFATGGTERARITSGGKLLLGTTTTAGTLTVDGVDTLVLGTPSTYAVTCGNTGGDSLAFGSDASGSYIQSFGGNPLIINSQGNEVRIAAATDQGLYNLQCNGTGVWGAGAYVNGSDERLKDNIQTLDDGLAVVTQLRPVTFQYRPEHSKDQSIQPGFIAQELQQAMAGKPYLEGVVQSGPEYLNVAYQNLIPILTKAIQEQQALITDLRARVAALEGV